MMTELAVPEAAEATDRVSAGLIPSAAEMAAQFAFDLSVEDGFYEMDNETYHAYRVLSSSQLKTAAEFSALHLLYELWNRHINPLYTHESKKAFDYGTCLHTAILEPELVEQTFAVWPTDAKGKRLRKPTAAQMGAKNPSDETVALMAMWDDFNANPRNEGVLLITQEESDAIYYLRDKAYADAELREYLTAEDREIETSAFYHFTAGTICSDEGHDFLGEQVVIPTRVRPDLWIPSARHVLDVKSARNCHPAWFAKDVFKYGYHISAWFYLDVLSRLTGKRHLKFTWVTFEKTPPYEINLHHADMDTLEIGKIETNEALVRIARGIHSGKWAGYRKRNTVSPSTYKLREHGLYGVR